MNSEPMDVSVGVGQGTVLAPIITALYIALALFHAAPLGQRLRGDQVLQFFVDDGLIHVFSPKLGKNCSAIDQLRYNTEVLEEAYHKLTEAVTEL